MPDIHIFLLSFAALANALLGVLVLARGWQDNANRLFALLTAVTVVWIVCNIFMRQGLAQMLPLTYAFGALIIPLILFWSYEFTGVRATRKTIAWASFLALTALILALVPNAVVRDVQYDLDSTRLLFRPGNFMILYTLIQVSLYVALVRLLAVSVRRAASDVRMRILFVLFGVLVYGVLSIVTSFLAPAVQELSYAHPYDAESSLVLIGFAAYAALRYQLFNMRLLAFEILAFLLGAVMLFRIAASDGVGEMVHSVAMFLLSCILGYLLVRSGTQEVRTGERGEQLARHLASANARLRELDQQKTEFISIASHQLRSPITAIKGYSSMMHEQVFGVVPANLHEPLSRLLEAGTRIAIMVDDFLTVTRLEQGRLTYQMQKTDLVTLVERALDNLRAIAEKKNVTIAFDTESDQKAVVYADEEKLQQVFSNIIDNAIKYTTDGVVQIRVEVFGKQGTGIVTVEDNGVGIPVADQAHLFEKFMRASNANMITVSGTGLGLYLSREIVRAHNGWLHVSSEGEGLGTAVSVELPLYDAQRGASTDSRVSHQTQ